MRELRATKEIAPAIPTSLLHGPTGGKMFGVLVFEASDGRVGFIRAVSGQVERAWNVEGYAPPLFDAAARDAFEPVAEVVVKQFTARVEAARADAELLSLRAELVALDALHTERRAALKARHAANKAERRDLRAQLRDFASPQPSPGAGEGQGEGALTSHELDQLSRADDAERRRNEATSREERGALLARLAPRERHLAALERLRRIISREAMRKIWDTYVLTSFSGETTTLRELFPNGDPPSGAADCAAPRLLDAARRNSWKPIALAEFWWGAPPPGGARVEGAYYPACREKCGPVLPFLMRGLTVAPKQVWTPPVITGDLRVLFEDARFIVIDKPAGLLSVPARDERIEDNVLARVKRRFPKSTPFAVHRLDLDTSGLLLVALDVEAYRLLQRQFLSRAVEKQYVAILDGELSNARDEGVIELPMRVDLDQRPRQLVDFEHGRSALTRWKVLERSAGRTRVAFFPLTGRTHQLRVHAAHEKGLGLPIVGDRLYGVPGERLLLHAESLRLRHPLDGTEVKVRSPAPF
ncbi:MAG: RluA family pseudouridine synthase [Archangium sp.]|nr:RluA family pseudouridine synthase [Archangium sp.]